MSDQFSHHDQNHHSDNKERKLILWVHSRNLLAHLSKPNRFSGKAAAEDIWNGLYFLAAAVSKGSSAAFPKLRRLDLHYSFKPAKRANWAFSLCGQFFLCVHFYVWTQEKLILMVAPAVAVVVLDLPPMMTSMPLLLLLRNPFSFLLACRLFFFASFFIPVLATQRKG